MDLLLTHSGIATAIIRALLSEKVATICGLHFHLLSPLRCALGTDSPLDADKKTLRTFAESDELIEFAAANTVRCTELIDRHR
jgi:hypothetical protein